MTKTVEKDWKKIVTNAVNVVKVYVLENRLSDVLEFFQKRLKMVIGRYCKGLPKHVVVGENEDLSTVAQLELIETIKSWNSMDNKDIWPLAQMRILGAMRDYIRHLTKSDPSRVYEWVHEQAHQYITQHFVPDTSEWVHQKYQLKEAIETLTEREQYVVHAHVKLDLTFKTIGERINISESQISRIYKKSIDKLRKVLN